MSTATQAAPVERPHGRAEGLRRGDPRLRPARGGHRGEAREADRRLQGAAQLRDLEEARRARLPRRLGCRGVRRHRRRHGRRLPVPRGGVPRAAAGRRLPGDADHRRRRQQVRHRRAEAAGDRRHVRGQGLGDRDERARGRLRRRQPLLQGGEVERRLRAQRPEDLDLRGPHRRPDPDDRPHRQLRLQARGPDDVPRPDRRRGRRDQRDRDDGRQGGQRRLLDRLLPRRQPRPGRGRRRLGAADERPQRRAADHRRERARHRPAGLRRRARLHQGAQAVRPADRHLPDAASTGSPTWRPSSR